MIYSYSKPRPQKKTIFLFFPQYCQKERLGIWLQRVKTVPGWTMFGVCPSCGEDLKLSKPSN